MNTICKTTGLECAKCNPVCEHRAELKPCPFRWIPISERLPEEKMNPVTNDFYVYPVTYRNGNVTDTRYYAFGNGHWWHGPQIMDDKVIAWMPCPRPYKKGEEAK